MAEQAYPLTWPSYVPRTILRSRAIYAIAMHVGAMRGMERWGVGTLEQAFAGYKALTAGENWWDVLECDRDDPLEVIQKVYKNRAMHAHQTGSDMYRINQARDQAVAERNPS